MLSGDRTTLADIRTAHVLASRLAIESGLWRSIANFQHAARRIGNAKVLRDALSEHGGLIEAARCKPSGSKRQSNDAIGKSIGTGVGVRTHRRNHGIGKQLRERQILIELERLHQTIERKAVLKCGNGRVKSGRIGKALAANSSSWRRCGAARTCAARGGRQIATARAAETRRGTDSAESAILRKNSTECRRPKRSENVNRLAETKKELARMPLCYAIAAEISRRRRNKYSRSAVFFTSASARS